MKVLKFGGTSVGSIESLKNVKEIVDSINGKAVIVVSALGGLTDKLILISRKASDGEEWEEEMASIRHRHFDIINNLVKDERQPKVTEKVGTLLDDLEENFRKIALKKTLEEKDLDFIVSFGERMSSEIVAALFDNGKRYYSPDFIKTEKRYGKNVADIRLTEKLIQEALGEMPEDEKAIVPGFISTDKESGDITNLGRGGSDFTGALIASALGAEVLEIWTDVDGFMTADPRIVKDALIINHLTFTESMELCSFGAKVIYPPTIYPVFHKNIPIKILNTFNPHVPGTLVTDNPYPDDFDVKGVSALKDVAIVEMSCERGVTKDLEQRGMNALSKNGVDIIPLTMPEKGDKFQIGIINGVEGTKATQILGKEFAKEILDGEIAIPVLKDNLTALAIVGKTMRSRGRLAARLGHSLFREDIEVMATSGDSDTTLIYIINQAKSPMALRLIHSMLY